MKVSWHVYTCLIRNWTITIRKLLSNQIRFSTRIRWYADSLSRNQAYALCRHIRLLFGKRLDTILLRHRFRQYPDSPPTRCRIRSGFIGFFFSLWRADRKNNRTRCRIRRMHVDGRRIWKENSFRFKNIRIRVDKSSGL